MYGKSMKFYLEYELRLFLLRLRVILFDFIFNKRIILYVIVMNKMFNMRKEYK